MAIDLKNYMEDLVSTLYENMANDLDVCRCERCRHDVLAITLNSLPTKYIVTQKGEYYTRLALLQQQFEVDIMSAIMSAADMVKANPRHD